MRTKYLEKGQRFYYLTVIGLDHVEHQVEKSGTKHNREFYRAKCDCGKEFVVSKSSLSRYKTKSCGCKKSKMIKETTTEMSLITQRLYSIWKNIRQRCNNSNNKDYTNYGGRGIKLCSEWNDFKAFFDWSIKNGYENTLTIDRIDNNKNYHPDNCRWVTIKEQNKNRSNVHFIFYNGFKFSLEEFSEIIGMKKCMLLTRLNKYNSEIYNLER